MWFALNIIEIMNELSKVKLEKSNDWSSKQLFEVRSQLRKANAQI